MALTFSSKILKNDQIYFKNLVVRTPQKFLKMFGHFSPICMSVILYSYHIEYTSVDLQKWSIDKSFLSGNIARKWVNPANIYFSKSTIETLGKGVKFVQSQL